MWNATKIKREQRRLDEMVTSVGMPPGWAPVGRDKKGDVFVEFLEPVSCAVAQEVQGE